MYDDDGGDDDWVFQIASVTLMIGLVILVLLW